jgi:hypothetical protein
MLKSSELNRILSSSGNGAELKAVIQSALPAYRRGLAERGRSAPVELLEEGHSISITQGQLENLCGWYLSGEIDDVEVEYVAGLLDLSEDFQYDEVVGDAIFMLSSSEINGGISPEAVEKILKRMGGAA